MNIHILKVFSDLLFEQTEKPCCGSLFQNSIQSFTTASGSAFFTVNPIGKIDHDYKIDPKYDMLTARRADINVSSFRNFIFEMDNEDLPTQEKILRECSIPWTTITYSGAKSYHAILSLQEPLGGVHTLEGIEAYKTVWKRLAARIEHVANELGYHDVIDQSCKNPSRFTRYPTSIRKDGATQRIISLGSRISFSDFQGLMAECPKVFCSVVRALNKLEIESVNDFFEKAPRALVDEVKYPMHVQSAGMYPKIFRLSLWARDLGIDRDVWESVLNYRFFPALLKAGYSENKLEVGINHAFRGGRNGK